MQDRNNYKPKAKRKKNEREKNQKRKRKWKLQKIHKLYIFKYEKPKTCLTNYA